MSSVTYAFPSDRSRVFMDAYGVPSSTKDSDDVITLTLDWTDELATDETIVTSTWEDIGVTTSAHANEDTSTSCMVASTGTVKNTITTSDGRTLTRPFRFYAPRSSYSALDYCS